MPSCKDPNAVGCRAVALQVIRDFMRLSLAAQRGFMTLKVAEWREAPASGWPPVAGCTC